MNNFDLYKLLNFAVNKDIYAQAISPPEFQLELQANNMRHFRKRLGLPETYIPGQANEGAGVTRLTDTDLLPFLVEGTKTCVEGLVTLTPAPYYILDFYTPSSISSEIIGIDEKSSRLNNYITKPTTQHLAGYLVMNGLKILPVTMKGTLYVSYYRKPVDPTFVTTTDPVTLELTYSNTSVELEWDDGSKLDILNMILQKFGLNLSRADVMQMGAKLVETGK